MIQLDQRIDKFLKECSGRSVEGVANLYAFPSVFWEIAESVVEELKKLLQFTLDNSSIHTGITFILTFSNKNDPQVHQHIRRLRRLTNRENSIWIEKSHLNRFERYYNTDSTDEEQEIVPVLSHKKKKLHISDKLDQFCVAPLHVETLAKKITKETLPTKNGGKILLCKGDRFILNKLFTRIYTDFLNLKETEVIQLPVKRDPLSPIEPFIKSLKPSLLNFEETAENNFLKAVTKNPFGRGICRDRYREEFQYAYKKMVSSFVQQMKALKKPALLVCDGTSFLDSSALNYLEILRKTFEDEPNFFIIMIDDNSSQKKLPFPSEKIMTVSKKRMSNKKMGELIRQSLKETPDTIEQSYIEKIIEIANGSELRLYCSLVSILEYKTKDYTNPVEGLIKELKPLTLQVLYTVYLFDGIFGKDTFICFVEKCQNNTIGLKEHLTHLEKIGLIMKNCDGTWSATIPELFKKIEAATNKADSVKFVGILYEMWDEEIAIPPFVLLKLLEQYGEAERTLKVLFYLINNLLERRELSLVEELIGLHLFKEYRLNASEREDFKNIIRYTTIAHLFLSTCEQDILNQIRKSGDFLISSKGNFSGYCTLMQGRYYYLTGDFKTGIKKTKEALFDFQRDGNHMGEVSANLDMARLFLSQTKVRTAVDYADIACRISSQLNHPYSRITANGFLAVTTFLHGDLPGAERTIQYLLEQTRKEGCYEWFLTLSFLNGRIAFEYGDYKEAQKIFIEVGKTAKTYKMDLIKESSERWELRSQIYKGDRDGIAKKFSRKKETREGLFFLAELEIFEGNHQAVIELLENEICAEAPLILQSDNFCFIDGFSPFEGRYYKEGVAYDSLGDQIIGLRGYALGMTGSTEEAKNIFENLCGNRVFVEGFPYIHHFHHFYQEILSIVKEPDMEFYLQILNASVSELQSIAGRFGNQQKKRQFINDNFWNKKIEDNSTRKKNHL